MKSKPFHEAWETHEEYREKIETKIVADYPFVASIKYLNDMGFTGDINVIQEHVKANLEADRIAGGLLGMTLRRHLRSSLNPKVMLIFSLPYMVISSKGLFNMKNFIIVTHKTKSRVVFKINSPPPITSHGCPNRWFEYVCKEHKIKIKLDELPNKGSRERYGREIKKKSWIVKHTDLNFLRVAGVFEENERFKTGYYVMVEYPYIKMKKILVSKVS